MILRGAKGGASDKPPTRTPDNLRSKDTVEAIIAISEGPIKGLKDGSARNFKLGDTPLVNASGQLNFGDFELLLYQGYGVNERIRPALGGISNNNTVGVRLDNQTAVTRSGQTQNVDYLELRLVVNQLYKQKEDGSTLRNTLRCLIEYKPSAESTWRQAWLQLDNSTPTQIGDPTSNFIRYTGAGAEPNIPNGDNAFEREVPNGTEGATAPSDPLVDDVWIDRSSPTAVVRQWNGASWDTLGTQPAVGVDFSFTYKSQHQVDVYDNPPANLRTPTVPVGETSAPTALIIGDPVGDVMVSNGGVFRRLVDEVLRETLNPHSLTNGANLVLTGKTTSQYVKELRIPVERIAGTYDIRVTKISPDIGQGGDQENFIDVTWESFQEVIASDMEFDQVACIQLVGQSSDQLSGLPQFSGVYEGMEVRVPSNYDPVLRTYDGIWDGVWKFAYTNNPAFIWNEFKMNDRWGQSAYDPTIPNKWEVYAAGQHCDVMVDDGQGGVHPRYTFNEWITDPQGVKKLSMYIAGVFGAVSSDDGQGGVFLRVDKDTPAVGIITPEMCVDGTITYSRTDIDTRVNDITVTFKDPELDYEENRLRVSDPAHIAKYGRKPFDMVAVGCRNRQEALRRGRQRLITSTTEVTTASTTLPRIAWAYDLYDIVLIADPRLGTGLPGRVRNFLNGNKTRWQLRDPITLEPAVSYSVTVQVPNPEYGTTETNVFDTLEIPLVAGHPTGEVLELELDYVGALDLPEKAPFAVTAPGYAGVPKPFRILGFEAEQGDIDGVNVTLLEVNRSKQTYIDTGVSLSLQEYSALAIGSVEPPEALRVVPSTKISEGKAQTILELHWNRANSGLTAGYVVRYSRNGSAFVELARTSDTTVEFVSPPLGDYIFEVTTLGLTRESTPTRKSYSLVGDRAPVDTPTGLRVENGPSSTTFASQDAVLVWS